LCSRESSQRSEADLLHLVWVATEVRCWFSQRLRFPSLFLAAKAVDRGMMDDS
jgi:hypothetical protein